MKAKIIVLAALALLAGCPSEDERVVTVHSGVDNIKIWHDGARSVTCWIYRSSYGAGLSCWPDHLLEPGHDNQ